MPEALLHGAVAALAAYLLVRAVGLLPIRPRPSPADAAMTALIVFCVAGAHTLGIAAGSPLAGIVCGAIVGVVLASLVRSRLRRRA